MLDTLTALLCGRTRPTVRPDEPVSFLKGMRMPPASRRTKQSVLSLVPKTATSATSATDDPAPSLASLPEGWFCGEVGYVSETGSALNVRAWTQSDRTTLK